MVLKKAETPDDIIKLGIEGIRRTAEKIYHSSIGISTPDGLGTGRDFFKSRPVPVYIFLRHLYFSSRTKATAPLISRFSGFYHISTIV